MPSLEMLSCDVLTPAPAARKDRLLWRRMLLISLVLRLAVVGFTWSHGSAQWFFGQASELAALAESLQGGHGFSDPFGPLTGPSAFLAPGYPAIVAAVFAAFGPFSFVSAVAITLLQTLFAGTTTVVLMGVAQRAFGTRTANLAGAAWAIGFALLWVPTIFWETSLSMLLLMALLGLALLCRDARGKAAWLAMGATGALALLINSSLLTVMLCCMGWAAWAARRRGVSGPVLALVTFLALSSFWPVRNLRVLHAWIPLRTNLGYELWQGNRPGADAFFQKDLHPNTNAVERQRWETLGEVGYMREKYALAKAAIAAHPRRFLELTAKRVVCFWSGVNRANSWIILTHIAVTSCFGFWGAVLLARRRRDVAALFLLPLLVFPLPYYVTHPDFRFRLVLDPILIVLGAYVATESMHRARLTREL